MALDVRGLVAGYGRRTVLDGVDLSVGDGEILALVGPNGCGKSTLLKAMARQLHPTAGGVHWDGVPCETVPRAEWARRCALLPQEHNAPDDLTVETLVSYGRFPYRRWFRGPDAADVRAVESALERTGMTPLRHRFAGTLSGGERQRAWIAMALAREPSLLLLDEPTTFLDVRCQCDIVELLRRLNRETGLAIVLVLHDLNLAARAAHRLAALGGGRLLREGPPEAMVSPEALKEVFGIHADVAVAADGLPYCVPLASVRA